MRTIQLLAILLVVLGSAVGCKSEALRAWQQTDLATHDAQRAFEAARDVIQEHFGVAEASWTKGTIESKPQIFEGKRSGTLADIRGAGGRTRRTVSFELLREGLTMVGRAAVRVERESTAAAIAIAESGGYEPRVADVPRSQPMITEPGSRPGREVWVETGFDAGMAKEILAQIADRIQKAEKGEAVPAGESPKAAADEARKLGAEKGP